MSGEYRSRQVRFAGEVDGTETFKATYGIGSETVARARRAVAAYARRHGVDSETLDAIRLAVSEAVTNAIRHAYRDGQPGEVRVAAAVHDGHISVSVEDDGCGHLLPSSRPGLGFGLRVIDEVADQARITERPQGGTLVRMLFPRLCADAERDRTV